MAKKGKTNTAGIEQLLLARRKEIKQLEATAEAMHTSVELDQSRVGRLSRMDAIQAHEMVTGSPSASREMAKTSIGSSVPG